VIPGFLRY